MTILRAENIRDGRKYVIKHKPEAGKVLKDEWFEVGVYTKTTNLVKIKYYDDQGMEYFRWIYPKDYDWEVLDEYLNPLENEYIWVAPNEEMYD